MSDTNHTRSHEAISSACDHEGVAGETYLTLHDNGDIGCAKCGALFVPAFRLQACEKEIGQWREHARERADSHALEVEFCHNAGRRMELERDEARSRLDHANHSVRNLLAIIDEHKVSLDDAEDACARMAEQRLNEGVVERQKI